MSTKRKHEDSVGGFLADGDNTPPALKRVKMPACKADECTGQTGLMLEWPCPKRHLICAHCLHLKIAEVSGWETKHDHQAGVARNVACGISCPAGCADSEVKFHEPGAMDKLRPVHPQWAMEWLAGVMLECPACHDTSSKTVEEYLGHAAECKKLTSVPCPSCFQHLKPAECANHGDKCAALLLHQAVMKLSMAFAAPVVAASPTNTEHSPLAAFLGQPASALKFSSLALAVFPKIEKALCEPKKLLLLMGAIDQALEQTDEDIDKLLQHPGNGMSEEVQREQGLL